MCNPCVCYILCINCTISVSLSMKNVLGVSRDRLCFLWKQWWIYCWNIICIGCKLVSEYWNNIRVCEKTVNSILYYTSSTFSNWSVLSALKLLEKKNLNVLYLQEETKCNKEAEARQQSLCLRHLMILSTRTYVLIKSIYFPHLISWTVLFISM